MIVDYSTDRDGWELTGNVRDATRITFLATARSARRSVTSVPSEQVWYTDATIEEAKRIHATFPDAEWSPEAMRVRKGLAAARKEKMAVKDGWIPVPMLSTMSDYETTALEDLQDVRGPLGVPPLDEQAEILLAFLQGREPDASRADETSLEQAREAAGEGAVLQTGEALYLQEAVWEARAQSRCRARQRTLALQQWRGVLFLQQGTGVLGDDMGAGKSCMTAAALHLTNPDTALIVTTVSTLGSWEQHIKDWAPGRNTYIYHGTPAMQKKAMDAFDEDTHPKVLITTHGMVRNRSQRAGYHHIAEEGEPGPLNRSWVVMIVDEAHKLGTRPKTAGIRAAKAVAKDAERVWMLTGTPADERPESLWSLFWVADPSVLGPYKGRFENRYCVISEDFFAGRIVEGIHPVMSEEFQWVIDPYFLRRLKREVVQDLPDTLPPETIYLPLTAAQTRVYRDLTKKAMAKTEGGLLITPDGLTRHKALEYTACGVPVVGEEGEVLGLEPKASSSNKLAYLLDVAESRHGDPFVVYAFSSKVADMLTQGLQAAGYDAATIRGSTPQGDRDAYVRIFQDRKLAALVITDAGAEGITLTAADLVIFAMESWRSTTNQQVRDRIDRWGQTRRPQTQILVSQDTVDVTRRNSVDTKTALQETVLEDEKRMKDLLTGKAVLGEEY